VGTSKGRIFRIAVSRRADSGDWSIAAKQIHEKPVRSAGLFSGLFGFGSSARPKHAVRESVGKLGGDDDENIRALAMGAVEVDGVDVWVLDGSNLSIWRVSDNLAQSSSNSNVPGVECLIFKADAISGIQEKLLELYGLMDDAVGPTGNMYAEGPDVGLNMAGGLPRQMDRREANILAMGVELLDLVLVNSKRRTRPVDPREPSTTPGSRGEDDMETETAEEVEEVTPVILVGYTVPAGHGDGGGISWQSAAAPNKKGSRRRERSYATIACRVVGVDQLAGGQASPTQPHGPILTFETPSLLPYSDLVNPRAISTVSPGVSIGLGSSRTSYGKEGWFAPRLVALQATAAKTLSLEDADSNYDDDEGTFQQWQEMSITVLVATFEGGMVFSTNSTSNSRHLCPRGG
jgi:hypothetical protein